MNQAKVLSPIHRLGSTTKPFCPSLRRITVGIRFRALAHQPTSMPVYPLSAHTPEPKDGVLEAIATLAEVLTVPGPDMAKALRERPPRPTRLGA
ncbi:hypothetical protein [Streptomyces europaeiscabiei]|uniref:hypothetical protein n=1 Tax=Streptomyces europaeiscabiei TaxID=146819 RepID=UPI0038D40EC9